MKIYEPQSTVSSNTSNELKLSENPLSVNRRTALKGGAVIVAAAMGLPNISAAQSNTPKKGGRLRMGIAGSSTTDTLDPTGVTSSMIGALIGQTRNSLLEIKGDGSLAGELAESWESTKAGADQWQFKLRRGVEFHDGKNA